MPKDPPIDRLLEKIQQEQLAYHKRLLSSSKEEIWAAAEEISLHNAICWLLETEDLTEQEILFLLRMDHPLEKFAKPGVKMKSLIFIRPSFMLSKLMQNDLNYGCTIPFR